MDHHHVTEYYFGGVKRPYSPTDAVFGSLLVSADSPTPYTDATQVRRKT